jgi:hypothetical protein
MKNILFCFKNALETLRYMCFMFLFFCSFFAFSQKGPLKIAPFISEANYKLIWEWKESNYSPQVFSFNVGNRVYLSFKSAGFPDCIVVFRESHEKGIVTYGGDIYKKLNNGELERIVYFNKDSCDSYKAYRIGPNNTIVGCEFFANTVYVYYTKDKRLNSLINIYELFWRGSICDE